MDEVISILRHHGVIAHPADTCYGLAGDVMSEAVLKKIQHIKGRDAKKPMSIMLPLSTKNNLENYVKLDDFSKMVCDRLLPGPITIVLPKGPGIPHFFFPETDNIGIRIPADSPTQELLDEFGGPLITTSANLSGEPICLTHEDVFATFKDQTIQPDLVVEGDVKTGVPSTVIEVKERVIKILREGPVKKEELENLLKTKIV